MLTNIQDSILIISKNLKILQFLNRGVVWALNGGKLIYLGAFFWRINVLFWGYLVRPQAKQT